MLIKRLLKVAIVTEDDKAGNEIFCGNSCQFLKWKQDHNQTDITEPWIVPFCDLFKDLNMKFTPSGNLAFRSCNCMSLSQITSEVGTAR